MRSTRFSCSVSLSLRFYLPIFTSFNEVSFANQSIVLDRRRKPMR